MIQSAAVKAVTQLHLSSQGAGRRDVGELPGQASPNKASAAPSYFVERGYRKMMLGSLYDATHEMAKVPATKEAAYQRAWLNGEVKSLLTAQFCFEAIAGDNEGAIEGLKRFCLNDPVGATKALHRVLVNFDCVLDKEVKDAPVMDVNPHADGSTFGESITASKQDSYEPVSDLEVEGVGASFESDEVADKAYRRGHSPV